jgi:hypothetical protein
MQSSYFRPVFKYAGVLLLLVLAQSGSVFAQENVFAAALKTEAMPAVPAPFVNVQPEIPRPHRFWDNQNRVLFATVAAFGTADFFVTRANLANGGKELNPLTRVLSGSTPALAANFVLETGGVIGVSYLFHRSGHHKLERMTSFVNIGGSAGAVAYGLAHR